jgi:hypothetical protein
LWYFGRFPPVLVCCTKKNLATLPSNEMNPENRVAGFGEFFAQWRIAYFWVVSRK